jgi:hypothetical protein
MHDEHAPTIGRTAETAAPSFTEQHVTDALDQASDLILDAVHAGDTGLRDALNLMINTTVAYLRGDCDCLQEVIEQNYGTDEDTVLGWITEAVR